FHEHHLNDNNDDTNLRGESPGGLASYLQLAALHCTMRTNGPRRSVNFGPDHALRGIARMEGRVMRRGGSERLVRRRRNRNPIRRRWPWTTVCLRRSSRDVLDALERIECLNL